jgi:hypothetical protein
MKVFTRAAGLLVLAAVLLIGPTSSSAATPPAGTISDTSPSTSWVGQFYAAMATPVPEACNPPPLTANCDHFLLTVDVQPDYWDTHTGGADITITWASPDNDFDLYVYDNSGTLVGFSAAGGTTSEHVLVENASTAGSPYDVRVVPFLVVASGYDGTANFVSQAGGPTPNPSRGTGGLAFSPPETIVDAQRTEGEPLNYIDNNGAYWESGPYGASTNQSFIHRSTDGGDQFNVVSAVGLRPDPPPGGGDTDVVVDDQDDAYFVDLEGLVNLGCATSPDDGNTWAKNPACVTSTVVDRQWFALDNGAAGGADNTVFLAFRQVPLGSFIYSTPGATNPGGGLVYLNSSAGAGPVNPGAPCGQMRFDPVNRNIYYPCAHGNHVHLTKGHVNPGQRTGIVYTSVDTPPSPGGSVGDIFPAVATDNAGNVYVVWVAETDHNVYYTASTDQGATWGPVHQINGNDANSNVWVWAQGGAPGKLAVAWYGNTSHLDSDFMPSWYNNRQAATAFPWFGYASLVSDAAGTAPSFIQQRFTDQPFHYGQICQGGLGCTLSGGDRTMADFFALYLDLDGSMRIVFNNTTSQHHGAHIAEVRQIAGPTALGGTVSKTVPTNPVSDPTGDAQSPHYFPVTGPGPNQPAFDFTQVRLSQPDPATLRVQMTVNNLALPMPPGGKTSSLWLTRFQALSRGDEGEESYRIFYVGAERVGPGQPNMFFAGSGTSNNNGVPGTGCTNTTPENCKIVQYPNDVAASGSVSGNVITIDVPVQGGFGAGRPILGTTLHNVTALSAGRNNSVTDVYADLDATSAFDFPLTPQQPPPTGACHVSGGGAIAGTAGSEGKFTLNAHADLKGKISYRDDGAGVNFRSTRLTDVECTGTSARIEGEGTNNGTPVTFIVGAIDNGESGTTDVFSITLSSGYSRGGTLTRGNIQVHE